MQNGQSKNLENRTTDISKHKREGKTLHPPFNQLPMSPSSWKDDRMPEMLWAVLIVGNIKREEALDIFRKVADLVCKSTGLSDITHSGIALWSKENRVALIDLLKESHPETQKILQPLVIFPALPGYKEWKEILGEPSNEKEVADFLSKGVTATLWHQSQEATDCRWIKFLCEIHGGKIQFPRSMEETVRGVFEYPNYGDLRHIRPFIRASEIGMQMRNAKEQTNWPEKFWDSCLRSTLCSPLPRKEQRKDNIKISHNQIQRIRHFLLLHYLKTDKSTAIEPRHDTIFGFGFYALRLLDELVATNLSRGMIGRLALRSCVEAYITLSYLIKKDDGTVWENFRNYGIGKMKLSYLKNRDLKDKPSFIDEAFLKEITNEDRWEEFSDIDLGNWTDLDLRKISIEAGCKEIYDAYYDWTSSFSHGNWGAVREANFAICANPLHRLHLIPSVSVYPLPGVLEDVVKTINLILETINTQYADLNCKLIDEPKPEKISLWKRIYSTIRYRKMKKFLSFITGENKKRVKK